MISSILDLYQCLLAYRRATPALGWGSHHAVEDVPEACYVFVRQADDQRVLVALNFSDREQRISLSPPARGEIVLSTYLDREGIIDLSQLILRSDEGIIVEL